MREFSGVLRGKRAIERDDDDVAAGHGAFAESFFAFEGGQQGGRFASEHFCGVRSEGEYGGLQTVCAGEICSFAEYGAMSAMNTVEVADGHESGWFFLFVHETIHRPYVINPAAERKACGSPNRFQRLCLDGPGDDW